jgi:hypothetical protein
MNKRKVRGVIIIGLSFAIIAYTIVLGILLKEILFIVNISSVVQAFLRCVPLIIMLAALAFVIRWKPKEEDIGFDDVDTYQELIQYCSATALMIPADVGKILTDRGEIISAVTDIGQSDIDARETIGERFDPSSRTGAKFIGALDEIQKTLCKEIRTLCKLMRVIKPEAFEKNRNSFSEIMDEVTIRVANAKLHLDKYLKGITKLTFEVTKLTTDNTENHETEKLLEDLINTISVYGGNK